MPPASTRAWTDRWPSPRPTTPLLTDSEQRDMRMNHLRHGTVVDARSKAEDEAAPDAFLDERSDNWAPARIRPIPTGRLGSNRLRARSKTVDHDIP